MFLLMFSDLIHHHTRVDLILTVAQRRVKARTQPPNRLYCWPPLRNSPIVVFKNFSSAALLPAPAVCPQSDGIGVRVTVFMKPAS